MVSTAVLVTVVLAAFATLGSAIYALASRIGTQVDLQGQRMDQLGGRVEHAAERLDARMDQAAERLGARIDRVADELAALRAGVAGLDARVATLEQR
jgi:hypothetical protein